MSEGPSRSALEFLGTLAGGLVHEIKNPLSTLSINLTLLKEDLEVSQPSEPALVRRVEMLEGEVRRLDAVLEDFLRYAGMRSLDTEPGDLGALVAEMVEFVRPGFQRDGVDIVAEIGSVPVEVDAALFKQALLNLLLNAQQALERGGRVAVTARPEPGCVVLEVTDNGCGIPPDQLDRVFDVYFSASKSGSGLGLPTARRIIEEHGGSLTLRSTAGEGTCVRMELPSP
jgi:signal transduction histidine kinase